jgi:hypothetical protein
MNFFNINFKYMVFSSEGVTHSSLVIYYDLVLLVSHVLFSLVTHRHLSIHQYLDDSELCTRHVERDSSVASVGRFHIIFSVQ